jgi:hypothetical protein
MQSGERKFAKGRKQIEKNYVAELNDIVTGITELEEGDDSA